MNNKNSFDDHFNRVHSSRLDYDNTRAKLIEETTELNEAKRVSNLMHVELMQHETEISKMKANIQELKIALIKALIEKEELLAKKATRLSNIEKSREQIENTEREASLMTMDEEVDQFCQRFSTVNQLSILNKIQDSLAKVLSHSNAAPVV